MAYTVSQLTVYPVKSMAGSSLSTGELVSTGLRYDRTWMVIDENGRFLTQRQHPEMALVMATPTDNALTLEVPGSDPIVTPIVGDEVTDARRTVNIWGETCNATDQGDTVAEALTAFFRRPSRLVHVSQREPRRLGPSYPSPPGIHVGFADSSPLHLVSEASLNDLNDRLEHPVSMDRFRPNIVVTGTAPFEEDTWTRVRIGEVVLRVVKDCIRCQIINVDQQTGTKGIDPLETLGAYRSGPKGPRFGRKVVHEQTGTIRVGDTVEILETAI